MARDVSRLIVVSLLERNGAQRNRQGNPGTGEAGQGGAGAAQDTHELQEGVLFLKNVRSIRFYLT